MALSFKHENKRRERHEVNVKERIISLRLIKKKEDHIEFLEEIGVAATVKVNDSNPETEEKTSCIREEK